MSRATCPSAASVRLLRRNNPTVRTKCGLVELAGIEPRSLVGSSLKLLSPTLAEGDHPPRTLPTKG
ncbi:MAG TPA: hypothetical protein VJR69_01910, partial [Nitrospira sp.]|nr:hypothetical protein [Nitrospira sp.]